MRTSNNGGKDHIKHQVKNDEPRGLTKEEAKEQLLWELRNQLGTITFEVRDNVREGRGDGVVIAKINGEQVDHYIYHEEEE